MRLYDVRNSIGVLGVRGDCMVSYSGNRMAGLVSTVRNALLQECVWFLGVQSSDVQYQKSWTHSIKASEVA